MSRTKNSRTAQAKAELSDADKKLIKEHHKHTSRHTLKLELELTEDEKRHAFHMANTARILSNDLTGWISKRLKDLFRTKAYRAHLAMYKEVMERKIETEEEQEQQDQDREAVSQLLAEDQKKWRVTFDDLRRYTQSRYQNLKLNAQIALTVAEDVWSGVEKVLYSDGKHLHFKKRGDLPILRGKQVDRAIMLKLTEKDGKPRLTVSMKGVCTNANLLIRKNDIFARRELYRIRSFMQHPENEIFYARKWEETQIAQDTFRPCYVSIKCEQIRGKLRVFAIITIEGKPVNKIRKDGSARHSKGKGVVGMDLGTQSAAAYSAGKDVLFINLGERNQNYYPKKEKRIASLQRKLDRQRRAGNPDHYNEDGTIKRGGPKRKWKKSKRMRKTENQLKEEHRRLALTREYVHKQTVNALLSMGDVLVTEPSNARKLAKRSSRPAEINEKTGRYKRKKRFGRSINRRAPGTLFALAKAAYGSNFHTVPGKFRASQYDHTDDSYKKKKLSERTAVLSDGKRIPRDLYSAFLLANASNDFSCADRSLCIANYEHLKKASDAFVQYAKTSHMHILNSGI